MEDVTDRGVSNELDQWVEQLNDCKQLTENQVKTLTDKVNIDFIVIKNWKIVESFWKDSFSPEIYLSNFRYSPPP